MEAGYLVEKDAKSTGPSIHSSHRKSPKSTIRYNAANRARSSPLFKSIYIRNAFFVRINGFITVTDWVVAKFPASLFIVQQAY